MSKKPVAVTLRKPQAPADVEGFVGGPSAPAKVRVPVANAIETAAEVFHAARAYREMTFYLPAEVARQLSFHCMDRGCDANQVVADAVSRYLASVPAHQPAPGSWGGTLEVVMQQLRLKLSAFWPLRPF